MLFITTIYIGKEYVKRLRRRLGKTAINTRTSREIFKEASTKKPSIPLFIDIDNHYINSVDIANQLRALYTT